MLRFTTVYTHKVLIVNLDAQFRSQGKTIKRISNKNSVRWNGFDSWKSSLTFPICKQTTENHSRCIQQPTRLFFPERSLKPSPLPFWRTNPKSSHWILNIPKPHRTRSSSRNSQNPGYSLCPQAFRLSVCDIFIRLLTPFSVHTPIPKNVDKKVVIFYVN